MRNRKKGMGLIGIACLALLVGALWVINRTPHSTNNSGELMAQMEEALGDEWGKVSETEVVPLTFADDEGDTIICYVCKTAYYTEEIPEVDNLTTVLDEIISPETAEESRSCKVSSLDAMLYKKNGRGFLRWTASPQYSFIIEFTLKNIPEEDIFRMAESIRANTEQ